MGKWIISCEEATTICTKSQYGEATLLEKIKLNFHLAYCKYCRKFSKQNSKLSDMCNLAKGHQDRKTTLSEEDKDQWKAQLKGFENKED